MPRSTGSRPHTFHLLALAAYCGVILYLCLKPFHFNGMAGHNGPVELIPFTYTCAVHGRFCLEDVTRNIVLFLPFGSLVAALRPRGSMWIATFAAAAFSSSIEVVQLFIPPRAPSTKDILANVIGGALGATLYVLARRTRQQRALGSEETSAP